MKHFLLFIFAVLAALFTACNTNDPSRFVGVWEPMGAGGSHLFVISADSIKVVNCYDGKESLQSHYTITSDKTVELERCWMKMMEESIPNYAYDAPYIEEIYMYFDKENYLIIEHYNPGSALQQYASFDIVKLKKYSNEN